MLCVHEHDPEGLGRRLVIRIPGTVGRHLCPKGLKTLFLEGLKKALDLHLNQIVDVRLCDMYFVFKTRIAGIYVFYKTVQYGLCNHNRPVAPAPGECSPLTPT